MAALTPPPGGRRFTAERPVRLGDVTPGGRLRLDAVARYLQDVAADDSADAGADEAGAAWVVRRCRIEMRTPARYQERLTVTTWCSGVGSRWAERSTTLTGEHGADLRATALWVHVSFPDGRPRRLPPGFEHVWGGELPSVSHRLTHPAPVDGEAGRPWPLRVTDLDVLGHVNNAAYWEPVEEELGRRRDVARRLVAEVEHRAGIDAGAAVEVVVADEPDAFRLWLLIAGAVAGSAWVQQAAPG